MKWLTESLVALRAVDKACELFETNPGIFNTWTKESSRDVVTDLDVRLEEAINSVLRHNGIPILSEETCFQTNSEHAWIVDSLDGTLNFLNGIPFFAFSVGLRYQGKFVAGAVAFPALQELYFTYGSEASFMNGRRLRPVATQGTLFGAAFGTKINSEISNIGHDLFSVINRDFQGCLRIGSAAALTCMVAKGSLQGAFGFGVKIWDVAAGLAVCKNAGYEIFTRSIANTQCIDFFVGTPNSNTLLRNQYNSLVNIDQDSEWIKETLQS